VIMSTVETVVRDETVEGSERARRVALLAQLPAAEREKLLRRTAERLARRDFERFEVGCETHRLKTRLGEELKGRRLAERVGEGLSRFREGFERRGLAEQVEEFVSWMETCLGTEHVLECVENELLAELAIERARQLQPGPVKDLVESIILLTTEARTELLDEVLGAYVDGTPDEE